MDRTDVDETTRTKKQVAAGDCLRAYRSCREAAAFVIQSGTPESEVLVALQDCADVNLMTANMLMRSSQLVDEAVALCARVTEACADALGALDHHEGQVRTTFAACRRARLSCLAVVGGEEVTETNDRDETLRETFPASDPPPPPTEL